MAGSRARTVATPDVPFFKNCWASTTVCGCPMLADGFLLAAAAPGNFERYSVDLFGGMYGSGMRL